MVNLHMNSILADALHRERYYLFRSLKLLNLFSHLYFLRECKRRTLLPFGFRAINKIKSTYPSAKATALAEKHGRQWMTLTINEIYGKIRFLTNFPCGPLTESDSMIVDKTRKALRWIKHSKM